MYNVSVNKTHSLLRIYIHPNLDKQGGTNHMHSNPVQRKSHLGLRSFFLHLISIRETAVHLPEDLGFI